MPRKIQSNLAWFSSSVQDLVKEFEFAPNLETCSWMSSVAKAAARPLPVSYDPGDLCPMLRGQPVDVLSTFIVIGAVEELDQKGRTCLAYITETKSRWLGKKGKASYFKDDGS